MVHQLTEGLSLERWAHVLAETLPWLQHHRDKVVMVRYGGNAMTDLKLEKAFAQDMVFLRTMGVKPVVVHGGSPQISSMLKRLRLEGEFRGSFRVTTPEVMEIVHMVLFGQIGCKLVGLISVYGPYAVGTSGEDGGLFTSTRRMINVGGREADIGLVGNIAEVHSEAPSGLIDAGRIPVVSAITPSADGKGAYSINTDMATGALVSAVSASRLVTLANVEGLCMDWPNHGSLIPKISTSHLREILPTLDSGMIPEMESYLNAVGQGVPAAHVIDGRQPHSMLLELMTSGGISTMVKPG